MSWQSRASESIPLRPSVSRQARSKLAQSGRADAFHWIRIFAPLPDSNDHFHEGRLGTEPFLQPHIVQPERLRDGIHTVLPRQFHRRGRVLRN